MIRRSAPAGTSRVRGFTIAELLVVLLIIGVATAVVVPALRGPAQGAALEAARELASAYEAARNAAVDRGLPVVVRLDPRTGDYAVLAAVAPWAAPDTLRAGRLRGGPGTVATTAVGPIAATFDPLRRVRGGAVFIRDGEERYEVAADPWTAAVRVRRR